MGCNPGRRLDAKDQQVEKLLIRKRRALVLIQRGPAHEIEESGSFSKKTHTHGLHRHYVVLRNLKYSQGKVWLPTALNSDYFSLPVLAKNKLEGIQT